jgi:hypothetical protein
MVRQELIDLMSHYLLSAIQNGTIFIEISLRPCGKLLILITYPIPRRLLRLLHSQLLHQVMTPKMPTQSFYCLFVQISAN